MYVHQDGRHTCRILGQSFCFDSTGMELVTTRVSNADLLILSTALPDSTLQGCMARKHNFHKQKKTLYENKMGVGQD